MQSYIGVEDNFLLENGYLVARVEEIVLSAEDSQRFTVDDINEIFRIMHTIKSSAGIMMYENISTLAHKLEDVFYYLRETYPLTAPHEQLVKGILDTADFITAELVKIQAGEKADGDSENIIVFLDDFLTKVKEDICNEGEELPPENIYTIPEQFYVAPKADEVIKYYRVSIYYRLGTEMSNVRAYSAIFALKEVVTEMTYTPEDIISNEDAAGTILREGFHILLQSKCPEAEIREIIEDSSGVKKIEIQSSSVEEFLLGFSEENHQDIVIRLDDDWMAEEEKEDLIPGDYVIQKETGKGKRLRGGHSRLTPVQDMISIPATKLAGLSDLTVQMARYADQSEELAELIEEMQEVIRSMERISMKEIFHKMNRTVYDISRKLNKLVELDISGEDTEIERNAAGLLSDALMHIIRNAVDHGIEDKRERMSHGKTAKGRILLEAGSLDGEVYVSVSDDGIGLNKERIYEVASERGLTEGREWETFTDKEIYQFILSPGFSTRNQVTEYAGRGVGLDVVAENMQTLGGYLEVDSVQGQGTKMMLWLPQRGKNEEI